MDQSRLREEQVLELIKNITFFKGFTLEERKYFASMNCNVIRFHHGENIIRQGDEEYSLFILLKGNIRVTKDMLKSGTTNKTRDVFLTRLNTGAVFGEISLLAKRPRATSAYADGEVIVMNMDGEQLEQLDPVLLNKINKQLIELLINRLEDMNTQMMQFTS